MATETKTFYPQAYDTSDYAFDSISGPTNPVGKGSSNEGVYAEIRLTKGPKASTYISWPFNCSAIPKNATIDSVECKVATSISSISATYITEKWMKLYSGITAKGSYKNITGNTRGVYTLDCGNWTREELQSCNLYFFAKRSASSTSTDRYINFYGADLTVTYTYQSEKFMLKLGGAYNDIARVFKKISGIWVEQTELANVIKDGVRYKNGGEYVAPKKTVTIKGTGNSSNGYVTINGTKYTSAATVRVEGGTTVGITLDCDMYNLLCKVTLNGTVVHENSTTNAETYYHIVDSDCTITLASTGSGGGYKADIVTN